jgi:glycosyltransferase involved in cell wall biosynthesis
MRVGIYDAFWQTLGGGEKLAASFAEALQDVADVTLLAHEPVVVDDLGHHLDVDLHDVRVAVLERAPEAVSAASADFDVFLNCSFLASQPSLAARSYFIAMFPDRPTIEPTAPLERLFSLRDVVLPQSARLHEGHGFHPVESDGTRSWRWTERQARFEIHPVLTERLSILLTVSGEHRPEAASPVLSVEIDGVVHERVLDPTGTRTFVFTVDPRPGRGIPVRLAIEPFSVPGDPREFGVEVIGLDVQRPAYAALADTILDINHVHHSQEWLDSYDAVVSISEYTRSWVRRYWGRESVVVHPAVRPRPAASEKQRVILSVGRFSGHHGHCKKQQELVAAFRLLHDRREASGWELWLIGGAADPAYVEAVRREAAGLPVRVLADATGEDVAEALGVASLYWHAMGLGEDPYRDPVMFEHFGISIVEAMSAGAVPVVVGAGGQAEIVEDGVSGLLADTLGDFVAQSVLLLRDPELRRRMAGAAVDRSAAFTPEAFRARVLELVGVPT